MSKVKDALCVEYGEFDVTIDRDKYIGGSDIPAILGISKFKTRWKLLLEKAGLEENTFKGSRITEYGHIIEPQVRNHLNLTYNTNFVPNRVINGDIRYHSDGFDGKRVLEVKSTVDIYSTADAYKVYLVQLLKGMEENGVDEGILAVYHRPDDFDPVFDASRLQVFGIVMDDYSNLLAYVNREIDKFRVDLERLKENPLLSEQDFLPSGSLVQLADKVAKFENQLASLKEIENQCKEAKKALYNEMLKRNVKSWSMPNGTKLTRVDEVPASTKLVGELDVERFKRECPATFDRYCRLVEKKTSGKAGFVRITLAK
jgi:hypothetical protein